MARQFPEDAVFTVVRQGERVVGFVFGVFDRENYLNFFCGFDYQLNEDTDLYFNLLYEDLDYALRQNVHSLHVGQTADEFKSRVGCYLEPRFFYVKARDPDLQSLVRMASPYLFPPRRRSSSATYSARPPASGRDDQTTDDVAAWRLPIDLRMTLSTV